MSWPNPGLASKHFRFAKEPKWRDGNMRTICGGSVRSEKTYELREGTNVDCVHCMLVKDAWLETVPRKPLTVRRCRELWRVRFGGKSPLKALEDIDASKPMKVWTQEEIDEANQRARAQREERAKKDAEERVKKEEERAVQGHIEALTDARGSVNRRTANLKRLQTKQKLMATLVKRAERRLRVAQRRLARLSGSTEAHQ